MGIVLMTLGYCGWIAARIALGTFFTVRPRANGLVKTGIYSKIRNPIYVFSMIYFIGLGLHEDIPFPWIVLAVAVVAVVQMKRSAAEAAVLRQHYKEEYNQYENNVWV